MAAPVPHFLSSGHQDLHLSPDDVPSSHCLSALFHVPLGTCSVAAASVLLFSMFVYFHADYCLIKHCRFIKRNGRKRKNAEVTHHVMLRMSRWGRGRCPSNDGLSTAMDCYVMHPGKHRDGNVVDGDQMMACRGHVQTCVMPLGPIMARSCEHRDGGRGRCRSHNGLLRAVAT